MIVLYDNNNTIMKIRETNPNFRKTLVCISNTYSKYIFIRERNVRIRRLSDTGTITGRSYTQRIPTCHHSNSRRSLNVKRSFYYYYLWPQSHCRNGAGTNATTRICGAEFSPQQIKKKEKIKIKLFYRN